MYFADSGYLFLLLILAVINIIKYMGIIDIAYLAVVLGCLIKYLLIVNKKRK